MKYEDIIEAIDEIEKTLTFNDLLNTIEVKHQDGTYCKFHHAFFKEFGNQWFCIYTEHNGRYINNLLDIEYIKKITETFIYDGMIDEKI